MRLFFAIPIPAKEVHLLTALYPQLHHPMIRTVPGRDLHITVCFLGEQDTEQLETIQQAATAIAATTSPFTLQHQEIAVINKKKHPVMIWAKMAASPAFDMLCSSFASAFGTGSSAPFTPHITLARIKQIKQLPFSLPQTGHFSIPVATLNLYVSRTLPAGPEYTVIASWNLG